MYDSAEWVLQKIDTKKKLQRVENSETEGSEFDSDSHDEASIDSDYENSDDVSKDSEEDDDNFEDHTDMRSIEKLYGNTTGIATKSMPQLVNAASTLVSSTNATGYNTRNKNRK
jgi:hypothetical protein